MEYINVSFDYLIYLFEATFIIAVLFGTAWPLKTWAERKLQTWKEKPLLIKHLYGLTFLVIVGLCLVVALFDIMLNIFVSLLFKELPKGKRIFFIEFLTTRIQRYLYEWGKGRGFNFLQRAYIIAVVTIANKIDRKPHFDVPKNLW